MIGKKKFSRLASICVGVVLFTSAVFADTDSQKYYLGNTYLAKSDSDIRQIQDGDIHYGWDLGKFFINGYTKVITDPNKPIIFLKNTGDEIALWFRLEEDISFLNKKESLSIDGGGIKKRKQGQGTLPINYIDYQNLSHSTRYSDYLRAISVGADTNVKFFEEGDYEISLDYTIRNTHFNMTSFLLWDVDIHTLPTHKDYRINFKFSVRNGNCMIFLRDVKTQEELTSHAPNGFYLDLTKSRYLDINVKREILENNSDKLDVRFNKPAKDGDQYTEKGVYTITLKNRYTKEVTTKVISVGDDPILNAYAATLMPIGKIKKRLKNAESEFSVKTNSTDLKESESLNEGNASSDYSIASAISSLKVGDADFSQNLASIEKEVSEYLSKDLGEHKVEKVEAVYLSQEYLEELQYNSLANEYFGHSLKDLEKQFGKEKYVLTLDKDYKTVVRLFENIDEDIWGKVIKDVAIGSGVILVTATVSLATGGTATVVFAAAAKAGVYTAFSSALCGSIIAGTITGIQTKNFDKTVKAMAVGGAEGFKWGAIGGVVIGGVSKALELKKAMQLAKAERGREIANRGLNFEKNVMKSTGGEQNHIYFGGKRVEASIKGCSKPDIVRTLPDGRLKAIECKNYDLEHNLPGLISRLREQIAENVKNMPASSLQRLAINKRINYSKEFLDEVRRKIQEGLKDIYTDIPVDFYVGG